MNDMERQNASYGNVHCQDERVVGKNLDGRSGRNEREEKYYFCSPRTFINGKDQTMQTFRYILQTASSEPPIQS
jgi:hypothetical protein